MLRRAANSMGGSLESITTLTLSITMTIQASKNKSIRRLPMRVVIFGLLLAGGCQEQLSDAEYVAQARQHQQKGELKTAVIDLKNALQQNPKNAEARLLLGQIYVRQGDGAAAQKELELALSGGISYATVAPALGEAQLLQGNYEETLNTTKPTDSMAADTKAELLALRGRAYESMGKTDEANAAYQSALSQQPAKAGTQQNTAKAGALLGLIRAALAKNNYAEAEKWLGQAQTIAPNDPDVWAMQGEYRRLRQDMPGAEKGFHKALELNPQHFIARIGLVTALLAQNKTVEADKTLDAIQGRDRHHPLALYYLARMALIKNDTTVAQDRLQELLKTNPNYGPALFLMAVVQYARGNLEQASELTQNLLTSFPDSAELRRLNGLIALRKNRNDPAKLKEEINYLLTKFPQDSQVLNAVAGSLAAQGKTAEATSYLRKAADLKPDSAEARMRLGELLLAQGKPEEAAQELEKAKQAGPQTQNADVLLIMSYIKAKEFERALAALQPLRDKNPGNAAFWHLTGVAYGGMGQIEQAESAFRKVIELAPGDPAASANLAQLALARNDVDKAREYYRQGLARRPDNLQLLLGLAALEQRQGTREAYIRQVDAALQKQPDALEPRLLRAQAYVADKEPTQALGILLEIKEKYSANPTYLQALGEVQLLNGDANAAAGSFTKLTDLKPDSAVAYYRLAGAFGQKGDPDQMQKALFKALALQPDNPQARPFIARLLSLIRDQKQAGQLAQTLREKLPNNRQTVLAAEGDFALQRGNYSRATEVYKQGMAQYPDDPQWARSLAEVYRRKGDPDGFVATLNAWLDKHPQDAQTLALLADDYMKRKRYDDAQAAFTRLLELNFKDSIALNNLAWLLRRQNPQQAREYAERALTLAPDNPSVMDTLADILLDQGDNKRALELARTAAQKQPSPDIRYRLAKALAANGQNSESRQVLLEILADKTEFESRPQAEALLKELNK